MNHKNRTYLFFFIVIGYIMVAILAQKSFSQSLQLDSSEENEQEPDLEAIMDSLKSNAKAVRPILSTPEQYEQIIINVQAMQKLAIQAIPLCPLVDENAEVKQFEWEIGYKRSMLAVADLCLELELALHLKDSERAQEIYKSLGVIKKEGHNTYDP